MALLIFLNKIKKIDGTALYFVTLFKKLREYIKNKLPTQKKTIFSSLTTGEG